MAESGWSARALAATCAQAGAPVSAPTLRAWATGAVQPSRLSSRRALAAIEIALGCETGALTGLLPPLPAPDLRADPRGLELLDSFTARRRAWRDADPAPALRQELVLASLTLEDEPEARADHHFLLRAETAGSQRTIVVIDACLLPAALRGEAPAAGIRVEGEGSERQLGLRVHGDAELTRAAPLPFGLAMLELCLSRPLAAQEGCTVDLEHVLPAPAARRGSFHALALDPAELVSVQVSIGAHRTSLPRFRRRFTRSSPEGALHGGQREGTVGIRSMDSTIAEPTPCGARVDWEWADGVG